MEAPGGGITCNRSTHLKGPDRKYYIMHRHLWGCSEPVAPEGVLGPAPFSVGGGEPHLPSDSSGSSIWTPPSVSPNAN